MVSEHVVTHRRLLELQVISVDGTARQEREREQRNVVNVNAKVVVQRMQEIPDKYSKDFRLA